MCNSELFAHTPLVLFLNKSDLFRDTITALRFADNELSSCHTATAAAAAATVSEVRSPLPALT
jgi:hypothetical protein